MDLTQTHVIRSTLNVKAQDRYVPVNGNDAKDEVRSPAGCRVNLLVD